MGKDKSGGATGSSGKVEAGPEEICILRSEPVGKSTLGRGSEGSEASAGRGPSGARGEEKEPGASIGGPLIGSRGNAGLSPLPCTKQHFRTIMRFQTATQDLLWKSWRAPQSKNTSRVKNLTDFTTLSVLTSRTKKIRCGGLRLGRTLGCKTSGGGPSPSRVSVAGGAIL